MRQFKEYTNSKLSKFVLFFGLVDGLIAIRQIES